MEWSLPDLSEKPLFSDSAKADYRTWNSTIMAGVRAGAEKKKGDYPTGGFNQTSLASSIIGGVASGLGPFLGSLGSGGGGNQVKKLPWQPSPGSAAGGFTPSGFNLYGGWG